MNTHRPDTNTQRIHERSKTLSRQAWAEAAAWVVKLQRPRRDAALEAGWRAWLAEHPDHAFAWEIASDTWTTSHDISPNLALPAVQMRRGRVTPKAFAWTLTSVGACVVLLAAVFAFRLFSGTSFATDTGEQRTLSLRDGTRVQLNTDTKIRLEYDERVRRVALVSGEAFFSVVHERRPFVVMAGDRKIIAVGTSFMVRKDEKTDSPITVTLIEGRVAVADAKAADLLPPDKPPGVTMLKSGERLNVKTNGQSTVDLPSMDRATGWMRGQVIFDRTTLVEAAAELNRYGAPYRLYVAPSAAQIRVGGSFRVGDSESFARAVAATYNLSLIRRGDQLILGRPEKLLLRGL